MTPSVPEVPSFEIAGLSVVAAPDPMQREERDRTQRCLDTAAVLLVGLDVEGRITLVNRFACAMLGRTSEELIGLNWFETVVPLRDQAKLVQSFADVLDGRASVVRNVITTKAGEERLIEWHNTVVCNDAGKVVETFSSGTDITQQNQAVEALHVAEERMRFALEAADVGIWDMDCGTGVLRWSEILEGQYDLKPGTFGGTFENFVARLHHEDRSAALEVINDAMARGTDFSILHRSVGRGGGERWISGAGRFYLGPDGKPVRGVGISQDVTERHEREARSRQALKMEAIGRLSSGVAHDFNNLLTVIQGCADVMLNSPPGEQRGDELAEIVKAVKRAAELTRQLFALGRQQVLDVVPVDLNALLIEMTGMVSRLLGEEIQIANHLAPDLAMALADRGQIERVITNLVINARDAMDAGGTLTFHTANVELEAPTLRHEGVAEPGRYVMLSISDTGVGMTKETQARLFEPFFTTKEPGQGTGLGLATAYGIVKQSGGYIAVDSELGKGSIFTVYLPCGSAAVSSAPEPLGM